MDNAGEVLDADDTKLVVSPGKESSDQEASKNEGEEVKEPAVEEKRRITSGQGQTRKGSIKPGFEFTPNAPAWTPGGVSKEVVEENTSPIAEPPDDKAEGTLANSSSKTIPQEGGGRAEAAV